ncbi:MAG: ABC transporter permease, partial [Anaerolineae bacterium]|nr:ABC transporter permease [Anaerolineae bacterium]
MALEVRKQMNQPVNTSPEVPGFRARRSFCWRRVVPVLVLALFLVGWEVLVRAAGYPTYILPSPGQVGGKFLRLALDGTLARHITVTLVEIVLGLGVGVSLATVTGYFIARHRVLEQTLSPYLIASQAVPVVAIAPLLVIWLGPGLAGKVVICALIVFFPVLVNTIAGVRNVPADYYDLMRLLNASPWQVFSKVEVPAALPVLLAGLKIGATLSVIGAVVGELAGSEAGLGFMINLADGLFDTTRVFVGVLTLVILALGLYGLVALLERWLLRW